MCINIFIYICAHLLAHSSIHSCAHTIHIQHPSSFPLDPASLLWLWLLGLFFWPFLFPGSLSPCFPQALPALGTLSLHLKLLGMFCLLITLMLPIRQPLPCAHTSAASCGWPTLDLIGLFCPTPAPHSTAAHRAHSHSHCEHCHTMWVLALIPSALSLSPLSWVYHVPCPASLYLHTAARVPLFKTPGQANWRRVRPALSHP